MLPPLDTGKLSALLRDDDEGEELECDPSGHISIVKELITEDRNWSEGVMMLLELWPRTNPRFYRKKPLSPHHPLYRKGGPNNWWIDLNDVFFGSLRLKPSSGGVINIFAFGERVQSFQIMGCRRNWAAMIEWIWDYAKKLEAVRSKRKVLHTAKFKAQHGRMSKAKDLAAAPRNTDLEMGDVDATEPPYSPTTDTANPSGRAGLALKIRGMNDDERMADATVEGIAMEALKVVDPNS